VRRVSFRNCGLSSSFLSSGASIIVPLSEATLFLRLQIEYWCLYRRRSTSIGASRAKRVSVAFERSDHHRRSSEARLSSRLQGEPRCLDRAYKRSNTPGGTTGRPLLLHRGEGRKRISVSTEATVEHQWSNLASKAAMPLMSHAESLSFAFLSAGAMSSSFRPPGRDSVSSSSFSRAVQAARTSLFLSSSKPRPCGRVSVSLTTSRMQISRANENRWPFRLKGFVCSSRIAIKTLSSVWPRSPPRGPESVERSVQSLSCGRGKDPHQHHSPCLAKRLAEVPRWRLLRGRRRPRRVTVFTEPAGRASLPLFL
jgi:hypothetical protein